MHYAPSILLSSYVMNKTGWYFGQQCKLEVTKWKTNGAWLCLSWSLWKGTSWRKITTDNRVTWTIVVCWYTTKTATIRWRPVLSRVTVERWTSWTLPRADNAVHLQCAFTWYSLFAVYKLVNPLLICCVKLEKCLQTPHIAKSLTRIRVLKSPRL